MMCVVVWVMMYDGAGGGEGIGKVEWLILCCFGVLVTDRKTDICGSRVAFATESLT